MLAIVMFVVGLILGVIAGLFLVILAGTTCDVRGSEVSDRASSNHGSGL